MKCKYVLGVVLLSGCSSFDPYHPTPTSSPTVPQPTRPSEPIEPAERKPSVAASAVSTLLDQARVFHQAGSYQRSLAVAERAMRLDRHEPNVYLLLAANYLALKDYQQAEQLVQQGLPLARGEYRLESHFKLLLDEIHKQAQE